LQAEQIELPNGALLPAEQRTQTPPEGTDPGKQEEQLLLPLLLLNVP